MSVSTSFFKSVRSTMRLFLFTAILAGMSARAGAQTQTVTDIDGNVYQTVQIGDQLWMAENLKVTRYADGTDIANVTDGGTWTGLTSGAWAHYDNDSANEAVYGKLYNWYAVADAAGLCPAGWHVPTDAEWTQLSDYLVGESVAGGKMKATGTEYWASPNTGATNESGFTALPGGVRGNDGSFSVKGYIAYFWSSSELSSVNAWDRGLYYDDSALVRFNSGKSFGFSVRCLQDALPVANDPVNVTFTVNTATMPDTLRPSHTVQIRGGVTGPNTGNASYGFDWSSATLAMDNQGGDYWSATFQMSPGDTLDYKFWAGVDAATPLLNGGLEGWESGDNNRFVLPAEAAADTVLPLQWYETRQAPYIERGDSVAVWFRVNVGADVKEGSFTPTPQGVTIKGGPTPLDWGATTPTPLLDYEGAQGENHFYSGVVYFDPADLDAAGRTLTYKFYLDDGSQTWEYRPSEPGNEYGNRVASIGAVRDTTLHWVYFSDRSPAMVEVGTDSENILIDGDFSADTLSATWTSFVANWVPVNATFSVVDSMLNITDITGTNGQDSWHVQLNQHFSSDQIGLLRQDSLYRLSFDAAADGSDREIVVFFGEDEDPFNPVATPTITLSTTMTRYSFEFPLDSVYSQMKLGFELGLSDVPVKIDNVELIRIPGGAVGGTPMALAADSLRLVAFYNELGGPEWNDATNWLSNAPLGDWYGVTVEADRVTRIDLGDNNLNGDLSAAYAAAPSDTAFSELRAIHLPVNGLTGELPTQIFGHSKLEELVLYGNQMTGDITGQFDKLPNLTALNLGGNSVTGSIRSALESLMGQLLDLTLWSTELDADFLDLVIGDGTLLYLDLGEFGYEGDITAGLTQMTQLEVLGLRNNRFSGNLEGVLSGMTNLRTLRLGQNRFTGDILGELATLPLLQEVYINNNAFTGTIPEALGSLPDLFAFEVADNLLTGTIPASLGNLSGLTSLRLGSNLLSGTLPAELGNLVNLQTLDVADNDLSGAFPDWIYGLSELQGLYLYNNDFTGSIDARIAQLPNLGRLSVNDNRLEGELPAELGELPIRNLYLSGNAFTGALPAGFGGSETLEILHMTGNAFTSIPDLTASPALWYVDVTGNLLSPGMVEQNLPEFGVNLGQFIDVNVDAAGTEQIVAPRGFLQGQYYSLGMQLGGGVPAHELRDVEVKFGQGGQKAHRFTVSGQGSGVPNPEYVYQDYVDIPFQVVDADGNLLAVSFRDQDEDGVFNLISDPYRLGREYLFIHDLPYDAGAPAAEIAVNGGHVNRMAYMFWWVLPKGVETWDPTSHAQASIRVSVQQLGTPPARSLALSATSVLQDGTASVDVSVPGLTTGDGIYSYEFDLPLPAHMQVDSLPISGTQSESSTGELVWNVVQADGQRVLKAVYADSEPLAGGDTPLFTIAVRLTSQDSTVLQPSRFVLNTQEVADLGSVRLEFAPMMGDVDGNGTVQAFDAAVVLQHVVGLDPLPEVDPMPWDAGRMAAADVDGNGTIQAMDASWILQYLVELIADWPANTAGKAPSAPAVEVRSTGDEVVFTVAAGGLTAFQVEVPLTAGLQFGEPTATGDGEGEGGLLVVNEDTEAGVLRIALAGVESAQGEFLRVPYTLDPSVMDGARTLPLEIAAVANTEGRTLGLELMASGTGVSTGPDGAEPLPERFELRANYPNPFNPATQIRFALPEASEVRLEVFDAAGRRVAVLADGMRSAGVHTVSFQAGSLSSGVYIARLTAPGFVQSRAMVLLK